MTEEGEAPKYGAFLFDNGARYEGSYVVKEGEPAEGEAESAAAIMRNGVGTYKLDANSYEGEWVADKMHGHGLFKFMDGSSYDGDWVENQFHGQGKYQWATGAYYMGAWEKNRMHGEGVFVDDTGREWKGKFYNGQGPGLHTLPKPKQEAVNGS
uniref:MORN repeat-containing protein 5 n=1 Tax=Hanusia phi TaxID=3032 RepID=A0A7S0F073_9CRYP